MSKFKFMILGAGVLLSIATTGCGTSSQKTSDTDTDAADSIAMTEDSAVPNTEDGSEVVKYVPAPEGDCFIGERIRVPNDTGLWCEMTFYPDGKCELNVEDSYFSGKGTYAGTIKGEQYTINVTLDNSEEYEFVGDQSHLEYDDGLVKYVFNREM